MMKKRFFATLVCAMMLITLLPTTALAVTPKVIVGGTEVVPNTYYNNDTTTGGIKSGGNSDNYNVYYDAANNTLTLKKANITNCDKINIPDSDRYDIAAVYIKDSLTIKLEGNNELSGAKNTDIIYVEGESLHPGISAGIYVSSEVGSENPITITGSGTLSVSGGEAPYSSGIIGDVIISDGTVTATGGNAKGGQPQSNGIRGNVKITGGLLTAIGGAAGTDGDATDGSGLSFGISGNVEITGGSLTATGGIVYIKNNNSTSYGIGDGNTVTISGGTVNATGGKASLSIGINTSGEYNNVTISGGTVTAIGGTAKPLTYDGQCGSYGISTRGVFISGGTVLAKGNDTAISSWLDYSSFFPPITVSENISGSPTTDFIKESLSSYKYFRYAFMSVSPENVSMKRGGTQQFTAKVSAEPGADTSVKWTVEGSSSGSAIDSSGMLTVAAGETAKTLIVRATSVARTSQSATATVTVTTSSGSGSSPAPSPGGDYDYTPTPVTVYNAPSAPNATVWLTGNGLTAGDLLITERNPQGSVYNALKKLADSSDVVSTYNIQLNSGKKSTGSAMHLTFDQNAQYAGQEFTLVHQKADDTYEYFYDAADANGDLRFGPLYELSPFMLVKGRLAQTAVASVVDVPATGSDAAVALWAGVSLMAAAGLAAGLLIRRKRQNG